MNAMAYNYDAGLIDPFHGAEDLRSGVIECVGNPADRFQEDALRIMRALRFAANYDFIIEHETSNAIHRGAHMLNRIAVERINSELCKLLSGSSEGVLHVLEEYSDVIAAIIPEIKPCIGFEQNNRYHQYNVYDHIAHAVANYSGWDMSVKIALLLHDIGKPCCYTEDKNGGHFHGHGIFSHDISERVLERLRFDNKTKREILELVLYHDSIIEPTQKAVRRWLNKIGAERFKQLLEVRMADIKAHTEGTQASRIERCNMLAEILDDIIANEQCFSMKDMNVNGRDIMALGIPEGKQVGVILNKLLDSVVSEKLKNDHDALIEAALELKKGMDTNGT